MVGEEKDEDEDMTLQRDQSKPLATEPNVSLNLKHFLNKLPVGSHSSAARRQPPPVGRQGVGADLLTFVCLQ